MSAGAVFKLIANDGKADRMIMATDLLNQRIKDIMCLREANGLSEVTPTLVDIEKTHILFVNAHFKPFAAIGCEYNKTRPQSGNNGYGGPVQFSIPQYGDFFNDMCLHVILAATSATVGTVPALPPFVAMLDQVLTSTSSVSGSTNTTTGVYTKYTHEYVDIQSNVLAVGSPASNFVRYAEYPGERLAKETRFDVNGNPLDSYNSDTYLFHHKFKVPHHKMTGWKRMVGQEIPVDAYSDILSVQGTSKYPTNVANIVDVTGSPVGGAPTSALTTARKYMQVVCGAQTPQATQPALEMWIPLLFWFNKDPRLSIASVCIPYGQRFITVSLEEQDKILFTTPGNLFLRLSVQQYTSADNATKGTASAVAVTDVKRWVTLTPTLATNSNIDTTQKISSLDLYINNIFVNPEIHDIYIRRIGFSLIRVHRMQQFSLTNTDNHLLLSSLKWPIETIFLGVRPAYNISKSNPNQYRDWHRLELLTDNVFDVTSKSHSDVMTDDTVAFNANSTKHKTNFSMEVAERVIYPTYTPTMDDMKIDAHGISIFHTTASSFYNSYLPYTFGGINIVTPEDPGAFMLNFCIYPGTYQPSGHINLSRAREFYLIFHSSYINSANSGDLLIVAIALNFLLISDGSAVLRYST